MEGYKVIDRIRHLGMNIETIDGDIHIHPRHLVTDAIRQTVRQQKAALVDFLDCWQERAAIMEHSAHDIYPDRVTATAAAYEDCKRIFENE